ncbi:BPTI/Kunitz inhibitor domain-containing protein [Aphelenchoides fujianensis]|nr:BPTI/Kunitz inhibitor domain-containing protein [Aphelenchoides fujianensis]
MRLRTDRWVFRALLLLSLCFVQAVEGQQMDIPDKLDPFLELLFETAECESVVADEKFLVVDTRKCKPFTCNFPFESPLNTGDGGDLEGDFEEGEEIQTAPPPRTEAPRTRGSGVGRSRPNRLHKSPICEQTIPNGRFCGFQLKFTFNRATGNCEQFWFPGCRTEETNDNLFDGLEECRAATRQCGAQPPPPAPPQRPPPPRNLPTHGSPEPQIPFLCGFTGGGGGAPDGNQFSRGIMEWAGSALGGTGGGGGGGGRGVEGRGEYGGGQLGGGDVTQPPNLIRFIANTIRDVGGQKGAANGGGQAGGGAAVFTNLLQQFG